MSQAQADFGQDVVKRFAGLAPFATGLFCFMLVRWGVRGLFVWSKPWKLLLLLLVIFASLLSGFRGQLGFFVILFVVQFIVEGLWKTAFLPAAVLLAAVSLTPVLLFANKMPLAVQRTFAFLPVNIEPQVRDEAADSIQWRLDMWHEVWPEVPKYLLIGKGYAIDPLELYLTSEAIRMGIYSSYEDSVLAGDYHNGALSVLMPFGIFGAIGFLWLLGAGIKVLYLNRRYGDPQLKSINTLFLSYFITQCIMFFFVFGALDSPQCAFWGVLGLSVSLNGGVCRKKAMTKQSFAQPALEPAFAAA
jgi:O-antigen ligase